MGEASSVGHGRAAEPCLLHRPVIDNDGRPAGLERGEIAAEQLRWARTSAGTIAGHRIPWFFELLYAATAMSNAGARPRK